MKKWGWVVWGVWGVVALGGAPAGWAGEGEVARLIAKAEARRLEAARLEFEWRRTREHVAAAREALEAGDEEAAEALARRALREAELAIEQAATAEQNWRIAVPK